MDVILMFLLLTYTRYFTPFSTVSIVDFEQVNVTWVTYLFIFVIDLRRID